MFRPEIDLFLLGDGMLCTMSLNLRTNKERELIDVRDKICHKIRKKLEGNLRVIFVTRWVKLLGSFLNRQVLHMCVCVCMYVCMYVCVYVCTCGCMYV